MRDDVNECSVEHVVITVENRDGVWDGGGHFTSEIGSDD